LRRARALAIVIALAALAGLAAIAPISRWLVAFVAWIRGAGLAGAAVYAAVYVVGTVGFFPGALLTMGAGLAYGVVWGTALVSPASVVGAVAAFGLGRYVLREWVAARVRADVRWAAIDRAIERNGFRIVLLLRLSPIFPFNLLNYALGLTAVRFRDYFWASFVGMLPGAVLYVYLGSLVSNAAQLLQKRSLGGLGQVWFLVGLGATVAVTVILTRATRRALREALER
jgi:uncharacterized membrane protein YdjX (TVP38/TMEM64 family)